MSEPLKHIQGGSNRFRFTLIELLIVIGVIAILASLLLPVLGQAKRRAVRVVDLNNRRQSVLSILMYTADYSSSYPLQTDSTTYGPHLIKHGTKPRLVDQLDDYVGDFSIWQCLGLPDTPLIDDPINSRGSGVYSNILYFANREYPNFGWDVDTMPIHKTTHKNSKASMPILACAIRDHPQANVRIRVNHAYNSDFYVLAGNPSHAWYMAYSMQQVEGTCVAFMDGHAEWVSGNDLENVGADTEGSTVKVWAVLPDGN